MVASGAPLPTGLLVAFIVGLVSWLTGTVLFAIPFLRRRLLPRWVGYLLLTSAVWMLVGNLVIAPGGPANGVLINLVSNLGPVLLMVAISHFGVELWNEQGRTARSA